MTSDVSNLRHSGIFLETAYYHAFVHSGTSITMNGAQGYRGSLAVTMLPVVGVFNDHNIAPNGLVKTPTRVNKWDKGTVRLLRL